MKPTLLILAAGMGSRYGGLKQLDSIGPSGETLMDYTVYDAVRAGFGKVVFVIRKEIEADFNELLKPRYAQKIAVEYVLQASDVLPGDFVAPASRKKPWGTGHAVMLAGEKIHEPCAVVNADDFYGKEALQTIGDFLREDTDDWAMVAYRLGNTLSDHGHVSRGVCSSDKNNYLSTIVERTKIFRKYNNIISEENNKETILPADSLVSMNLWGLRAVAFEWMRKAFITFLEKNINEEKAEFFLPFFVNDMIQEGSVKSRVLTSDSQWFGMTYSADREDAVGRIKALIAEGVYPERLWK